MAIINTFSDFARIIEDQPVDVTQYAQGYLHNVARLYERAVSERGFSYGCDLDDYDLSEKEFWELWREFEIENR